MTRRLIASLAAIAVLVTLSACAPQSSNGPDIAAVPDYEALDKARAEQFDAAYIAMLKTMDDNHPVQGTVFKHAAYGELSTSEEWDLAFAGTPVAVYTQSRVRKKDTGLNLDLLHPQGSTTDYYLLGDAYASKVPTRWVSVPTTLAEPLDPCLIPGYQSTCDIQFAIAQTAAEGATPTKRVVVNQTAKTTVLLTGVTLRSMLVSNYLLNIPKAIQDQFTDEMLDYQVPCRFVLDKNHRMQSAEIVGTVPGPTPLEIQVGFQVTGKDITPAALPPVPPADQITAMTRAQFNALLDTVRGGS